MTEPRLTDELVRLVLGWRPASDRYLTSRREWIKRERFKPFTDSGAAVRLLQAITDDFSIHSFPGKGIAVTIRRGPRTEMVTDKSLARAITLAVAHLFDLELTDDLAGGAHG